MAGLTGKLKVLKKKIQILGHMQINYIQFFGAEAQASAFKQSPQGFPKCSQI